MEQAQHKTLQGRQTPLASKVTLGAIIAAAFFLGQYYATRDVAVLRAEVAQMEAKIQALEMERQEIFERWREIEESYKVIYDATFEGR